MSRLHVRESNALMPVATSSLNSEWRLLLAACSAGPSDEKQAFLRSSLRQPILWKSLFALADAHGVQPLLFQALGRCRDAIPPDEMRSLQQSHQTNLHKCLLLARELIRIVQHLSALDLAVMPYKGLALAELVYGDIAARQAGDIDLLTRATDFPRIREALRGLGYTPHSLLSATEERAYLKSGYECAFDGASGSNLVEVKWAILPRFYAVNFTIDELFAGAVSVNLAGQPMKTPSPADLFLLLAVHAAKHAWGRLIWLCDLARLMNFPNMPWDEIGFQARNLGIMRIARVTMLLAARLLGSEIPAAAQRALPDDPSSQALALEAQDRIVHDRPFSTESAEYFRFMTRLRERPSDRARFLHRLVFTPGPGEWNAIRLPSPLFPLYRLVRLSRLAARAIRT